MTAVVGISGGFSIDHLVQVPNGAKFDSLGGPGLYAALGARTVATITVRLHAELPDDGPEFERLLASLGVDISFCERVPKAPKVWILNSPEGRRLVGTTPPLGLELGDSEEQVDCRELPPPAFFGGLAAVLYSSPAAIAGITPPIVAVDPDQRWVQRRRMEYWRSISVAGGVLLPSRLQLAGIAKEPYVAARELARRTGVDIIARLDAEGMLAVTPNGSAWRVTDSAVQPIETTGAGDASAGAITAALAAGADLPLAAAFGVSAARVALSDWGHHALENVSPLTSPLDGVRIEKHIL